MNHAFELSMPWWQFVWRGVGAYLITLVMLRLVGKRSLGDMSTFDIIVLVLIGGALRNSIVGADTSFQGSFIAVASILASDRMLSWACARSARLNRFVEGRPTVLVQNGELVPGSLERVNLPKAAFRRALHTAGVEDTASISTVRLEPNGRITLIRKRE